MRTRRIAALSVAALLLVVAAGATPATAGKKKRWSTERWKSKLSQPKYSDVEVTTHYIEAEDGTQLSLTVHLPVGLPEGTKVPT
ncbi:MAG: hypothetical protein M3271_05620, partial [Actinomycetota bacterium]|nr:hypothetical protein [Actinomycetota bacterium]